MPVIPIPDDWNGTDWTCIITEWPDSVQWLGLLRGFMTTAARGRFWDPTTGTITDAQAIGREIAERNPVAACDELVTALQAIQVAIESLDISQDLQVTIQTNIQNSIDVVSVAIADSLALQSSLLVAASTSSAQANASAFAWSKAIAENTLSVQILNNTETTFRPIDINTDPPPQAQELGPTTITSTLEDNSSTEVCKRVYWLIRDLKEYLNYLLTVHDLSAGTVLSISGMLADGLWVAGLRADAAAARFLIPAAAFLSAAHALQELMFNDISPWQDLADWINDSYQTLICELADGVENEYTTEQLKEIVRASMVLYSTPTAYHFIPFLVTNFSSLAALYYESSALAPAPAIPAFEPPGICTFCIE